MDPELEISEYIKKHKINEFFNETLSQLLFHRPDNPIIFMKQQVENRLKSREGNENLAQLFTRKDIEAMVRSLDPTSSGFVTFSQYQNTLELLGLTPSGVESPENRVSTEALKSEIQLWMQSQ